jgi:hypothetical protein
MYQGKDKSRLAEVLDQPARVVVPGASASFA